MTDTNPHSRTHTIVLRIIMLGLLTFSADLNTYGEDLSETEPVQILHLKNGDTLNGSVRAEFDGFLYWLVAPNQELIIPRTLVDRVETSPALESVDLTAAANSDDKVVTADATVTGEEGPAISRTKFEIFRDNVSSWTKRLEFGGQVMTGNAEQQTLNLLGQFERTTDTTLLQWDFGGRFSHADSELIANRWYTNGNIDFTSADPWILFLSSKNEYDEIQNLDYRGTLAAGLGYRFYNDDERRLIVRVGPAVTHEQFNSPANRRTTPDLMSEVELRWPVCHRLRYEQKTTFRPAVDDFNVFRLTTQAGLLWSITEDDEWSLKLGLAHDYNSRPNPGRKQGDVTTSFLLVYARK